MPFQEHSPDLRPYFFFFVVGLIGAARPPLAIRMTKRAVYQGLTSALRSHLDYISSQISLLSETKDHQEAALSFPEKRKPKFEGK